MTDIRTHKQVLVIRKDLKMRQGKAVSQGAHAAIRALLARAKIVDGELCIPLDGDIGPWLQCLETKICVYVESETELLEVYSKALAAGIPASLIQDVGLTEFHDKLTYTAVAVGPSEIPMVDAITAHLPTL